MFIIMHVPNIVFAFYFSGLIRQALMRLPPPPIKPKKKESLGSKLKRYDKQQAADNDNKSSKNDANQNVAPTKNSSKVPYYHDKEVGERMITSKNNPHFMEILNFTWKVPKFICF